MFDGEIFADENLSKNQFPSKIFHQFFFCQGTNLQKPFLEKFQEFFENPKKLSSRNYFDHDFLKNVLEENK